MDPRKAALKQFLDFSRDNLTGHINKVVVGGNMTQEHADYYINAFKERSDLILERMDRELQKQQGGAMPKMPTMPKMNIGNVDIEKLTSPEQIQKDIDALVNFDPADHISPTIKPVLDNTMWIFVPKIRETVKKIVGTVFLLGSIEELPIFGPLIASSVDIAASFMPALATTFQNILPNVIGLAPIPYAAFIGEAAGYVFSSVLMFTTLMTQVSRGDFMEALEAGAGMLPVIGTTMMTYVQKGKKIFDKVMEMRKKIVISLAQIKGLMIFLLPVVSKKAAELLTKILPIFNRVFQSAAQYVSGITNFVLENIKPLLNVSKARINAIQKSQQSFIKDNLKPLVSSAKARLASIERTLDNKKGGRYTKRTRRLKRKNRKSRLTRSAR